MLSFLESSRCQGAPKIPRQKTQPGIQKIQNHYSGVRQLLKAKYVPFYRWKKVGWGEEEAQQSHIIYMSYISLEVSNSSQSKGMSAGPTTVKGLASSAGVG